MIKHFKPKIVIPFWKGLTFPFDNIKNNYVAFFKLTALFSLATSIISTTLGRSYACEFGLQTIFFCSPSPINSILSIILFVIFISLYINRWNLLTKQSLTIKETFQKSFILSDLKAFLIMFINILSLFIMGGSAYLLNQRKATPDFNLELSLFILFSSLITLSLIVYLNNVLLLRLLDGKKWFEPEKTVWPIFDNIYKYILWIMLYFAFFAIITKNLFMFIITPCPVENIKFIIGEFLINFTIYTTASFWISSLQYQEKHLFKED